MIVLTTRKPEISSRVLTPGVYTSLTLALFKQHLKWDEDDTSEDTIMQVYLTSAIKQTEAYTRRVIDPATWQTYLDSFHDFTFDIAPIVAISSVQYYNSSNVLTVLPTTEYTFINKGADTYAEMEFEATTSFPELYDRHEPVYVQFTAGYSTYPSDLIGTILQYAGDLFETRTYDVSGSVDQVTFGFHQRLFPYKML